MEQKVKRIEFRFGKAGKLAPLVAAAAMILWAAFGDNLGPISDTTIASSATQQLRRQAE